METNRPQLYPATRVGLTHIILKEARYKGSRTVRDEIQKEGTLIYSTGSQNSGNPVGEMRGGEAGGYCFWIWCVPLMKSH